MRQHMNPDLPITFQNKTHEALINVWWTGNQMKNSNSCTILG